MYYTLLMHSTMDASTQPRGDEMLYDGFDADDEWFRTFASEHELPPDIPDSLDLVCEIEGMLASFAAQRAIRVHVLRGEMQADARREGRVTSEIVERGIRLEIAAATRMSEASAGRLIAFADAMIERYPAVLHALERARMTERHAETLVGALDLAEPEFRDRLLAEGMQLAESLSFGDFRRALRTLVETVRAQTLAERQTEALASRRVVVEAAPDGMAWLLTLMPAVEAQAAFGRATAIAKVLAAVVGEERTVDQLRADVIGDLLIEGDTTRHPAEARGIRATVAVTVPALSLLADALGEGAEPPVVEGVGPIPLDRARELCGDAEGWMRILTHPESGIVLSVGRLQYRPPPALRKLVAWRADRCMAPGCGIPASRCQIDHTVAWEHGGTTSLANLAPLCVGHHTVKHHGGWSVRQIPASGGALEWTSPAGRVYVVRPERRVPVFRPDPAPAPF